MKATELVKPRSEQDSHKKKIARKEVKDLKKLVLAMEMDIRKLRAAIMENRACAELGLYRFPFRPIDWTSYPTIRVKMLDHFPFFAVDGSGGIIFDSVLFFLICFLISFLFCWKPGFSYVVLIFIFMWRFSVVF